MEPPLVQVVESSEEQEDYSENANQLAGSVVITSGATQPFSSIQFAQPTSKAAKWIGILLVIYGVLVVLTGMLSVVGGAVLPHLPIEELSEEEQAAFNIPSNFFYISGFSAIVIGVGAIISGIWTQGYKRKGIELGIAVIVLQFISDVITASLFPEVIGEILGTTLVGGLQATVCGLIVAIPLFSANNGLDNERLFGSGDTEPWFDQNQIE